MKLLVLGAGGMVGHVVTIYLKEKGYEVSGFARRELPFCQTIIGDIRNIDIVSLVSGFDVVINCIGSLIKSTETDKENGVFLNACFPHLLSKHAKRVIQISTDCVFSGHDNGFYKENDFRNSDYLYGRSKAVGELNNNKDLTFRMSLVGPEIKTNGIGLFHWFMAQNGTVAGYSRAIWGGVTSIAFAEAVEAAIKQNLTGLYHLTNGEKISKYELLKLFNGLRKSPVTLAVSEAVAEDKSITCTRNDFDFKVPTYKEMVTEMGEWILRHKELYTSYEIKETNS